MLGHVAVGTWSGGRFMRFGEPISDERLEALLRPGGRHRHAHHGRRLRRGRGGHPARPRARAACRASTTRWWARSGHDFYEGEREGAKGYPALHRPAPARPGRLRRLPPHGRGAEPRARAASTHSTSFSSTTPTGAASSRRRCGRRCAGCATRGSPAQIGVAPGPANGFTLDLIGCFERYGELIDWAMLILNPFEPWPGELALDAAVRHDVRVITRVVDYGGLFHDDVLPGHRFDSHDHRGFRPGGLGRGGPRAARAHQADRRPPRAHAAPARLRVEPRPPRRRVRGARR